MSTKFVLKERYGGRWGRQRPDKFGVRWRIVRCRHNPQTCVLWDVEYMSPNTDWWQLYYTADSYQAALDRVAYKRNRPRYRSELA